MFSFLRCKPTTLLVVIALIACGTVAHAQTITGSISGAVMDSSGGMIPGASTPARIANATFSRVGTCGCRTTINPATTPKATCDAMNHSQSMWLSSRGFSKESIE